MAKEDDGVGGEDPNYPPAAAGVVHQSRSIGNTQHEESVSQIYTFRHKAYVLPGCVPTASAHSVLRTV